MKFHFKWCKKQWEIQNQYDRKILNLGPKVPECLPYILLAPHLSMLEINLYNNLAYACYLRQRYAKNAAPDSNQKTKKKIGKSSRSNTPRKDSNTGSQPRSQKKFEPEFKIEGYVPPLAATDSYLESQYEHQWSPEKLDPLNGFSKGDADAEARILKDIEGKIHSQLLKDLQDDREGLGVDYYLNYEKPQGAEGNERDMLRSRHLSKTPDKHPNHIHYSAPGPDPQIYAYKPNYGIHRNAATLQRKPNPNFQTREYHRGQHSPSKQSPSRQSPSYIDRSSPVRGQDFMGSPDKYTRSYPEHSRNEHGSPMVNYNYGCTNNFGMNSMPLVSDSDPYVEPFNYRSSDVGTTPDRGKTNAWKKRREDIERLQEEMDYMDTGTWTGDDRDKSALTPNRGADRPITPSSRKNTNDERPIGGTGARVEPDAKGKGKIKSPTPSTKNLPPGSQSKIGGKPTPSSKVVSKGGSKKVLPVNPSDARPIGGTGSRISIGPDAGKKTPAASNRKLTSTKGSQQTLPKGPQETSKTGVPPTLPWLHGVVLDESAKVIPELVMDKDGNLLLNLIKDKNGNLLPNVIVDHKGNIIPNTIIAADGNILKNSDGELIHNIILDADKNIKPNIVLDDFGYPVTDPHGNLIPNIIRDKTGNPICGKNGYPIPNILVDAFGKPVMDRNGNPIPNVVRDKSGIPILDKNGSVIPNVLRDDSGAPLLDKNENFICNAMRDPDGSLKTDKNGVPLQNVFKDKLGNPIMDKQGNCTDADGKLIPLQKPPKLSTAHINPDSRLISDYHAEIEAKLDEYKDLKENGITPNL